MKAFKLLLITLFLSATHTQAQTETTKILYDNKDHYITTSIGYPITGTYLFEGKTEPILDLNANGTGIFQLEDLTKKNIFWGIECNESGVPISIKGYDSAAYTLWYKNKNGEETGEDYWIPVHFSIHFKKHKMFAFGDRSKVYIDVEE